MVERDDWLELARKLDWKLTYASEEEVFPEAVSGAPWLPHEAWETWNEPYRTTYGSYVELQSEKEAAVRAVREAVGQVEDYERLDRGWLSAVKLYAATFPLAEFAAAIGNLRAARFGRDSAWRSTALLGALDEIRHTQIPLLVFHDLVRWDPQFDWTHRFFHTNNWVAIAGRHLVDELLLCTDPIEFAVGTHFVFETGFTNLQFVGLTASARATGDRMFEKMLQSIQTDEARHAQIGSAVLRILAQHDPARAQRYVDKWLWRTWHFFAVVTGFAMDYLTPLPDRRQSFGEFVEEWILDQFEGALRDAGLAKPWYWDEFVASIGTYHHMVYAAAYTHRATVWFECVLPGPEERAWLRSKYPRTWDPFDAVWTQVTDRWKQSGPDVEWFTHGATPVGFCALCQMVLSAGTPQHNSARVREHGGQKVIFCSGPCESIYLAEPGRYAQHRDVVQRILAGEAPGNIAELVIRYFGMTESVWGKDVKRGRYDWLAGAAGKTA